MQGHNATQRGSAAHYQQKQSLPEPNHGHNPHLMGPNSGHLQNMSHQGPFQSQRIRTIILFVLKLT